ncbi:MAG: BatA domain-containing protein [Rhodothermales bacterium]
MLQFLTPIAFLALASLAAPLLIHLWSRGVGRRVRVGSLHFLEASERSQLRTIRLTQIPLMLLRMAMLAVLVVVLAQPIWTDLTPPDEPPPERWVLVHPAVLSQTPEASVYRMLDSLAVGETVRLLMPGFPSIDLDDVLPPETASPDVWSLLHEADWQLPDGSTLTVVAPSRVVDFRGLRPALRSTVDWMPVEETAPNRWVAAARWMDPDSLRVTVGVSGPTGTLFEQYRVAVDAGGPVLSDEAGLALEINGEQVVLRPPDAHPYDDALSIAPAYEERRFVLVHSSSRQDDARYVAAALRAVADVSGLPLVISITTDTDAIPAEAGGVFWLHEKAVPEAVSARVAEGLLLVSDAEGEGWQEVHRRVLLDTAAPATPPTLKRRVAALGRGHVEAVLITSDAQSATLARLADSLIAAPRYALPEARVAGFDVEIVPDAGRNTLLVGNRAPAGRALSLRQTRAVPDCTASAR